MSIQPPIDSPVSPRKSAPVRDRRIFRLIGWQRWIPLLLILLGAIAYSDSLHGVFLFDDSAAIYDNPNVTHPSSLIDAAKAPKDTSVTGRPTVSLTFALNWRLGGRNVVGYHLVNIAIHVLAGLTLFGIARRTMIRRKLADLPNPRLPDASQATLLAAAIAALWIVHPLQTESVTYIVQRLESLCGLFYLLTLYLFICAVDAPQRGRWFLASIVACVIGMGAKEVMATAPVCVLLYDYVFVAPSVRAMLRRRWAYYLALLATLAIPIEITLSAPRGISAGFVKNLSVVDYLLTQPKVILRYLRLAFWPNPLILDYRWPFVTHWAPAILPGLVILALLAASVWGLYQRHWLGFLGFAFFLMLSPTSSFVPLVDVIFEHRMYLPLACVIAAAVLAVWRLLEGRAAAFGGAIGVLVIALTIRTLVRNSDYDSSLGMWTKTLRYVPNNPRPMGAIADELRDNGHRAEAMAWYRRALAADPGFSATYDRISDMLVADGKMAEARDFLRRAVAEHPEYSLGWYKLSLVCGSPQLDDIAGQIDALQHLKMIKDSAALGYQHLGQLYAQLGRKREARQEFLGWLQLDPNSVEARQDLAALDQSATTEP